MPPPANPLGAYVVGTKAWFPDAALGWISATLNKETVVDGAGNVTLSFTLDDTGDERTVQTTLSKLTEPGGSEAELPPLRNPPLLEATDDLINLSHLNEASGTLVLHAPTTDQQCCTRFSTATRSAPSTHTPGLC